MLAFFSPPVYNIVEIDNPQYNYDWTKAFSPEYVFSAKKEAVKKRSNSAELAEIQSKNLGKWRYKENPSMGFCQQEFLRSYRGYNH